MSDQHTPDPAVDEDGSAFDRLLSATMAEAAPAEVSFTVAFRGYDREEVDAAMAKQARQLRMALDRVEFVEEHYRKASEAADAAETDYAERLVAELDAAQARARDEAQRAEAAHDEALAESRAELERLENELAAANVRAANAENGVSALSEELTSSTDATPSRQQFEEVLRVAEEQASLVIKNATVQADRLLEAAREEIATRRAEAQADAEAIRARAEHDAQQVRLRIDTELTAHQSQLERESAHAAEKVSQAEQEAAAIRTEAEKGAAALRSIVARETAQDRAEAEEAVRELRVRTLEFEESLTRRQDDAQQEFLVLHNQAVAHAERITQDANEQVQASLDHAQRVAGKADDFDRLMRAQSAQIEADANLRAREHLDRARVQAQKIIDTVTAHSEAVLRDAEDRTRQLRWQQHQLTSFMAEVKELIRPDGVLGASRVDDSEITGAEQAATPTDAELEELIESES